MSRNNKKKEDFSKIEEELKKKYERELEFAILISEEFVKKMNKSSEIEVLIKKTSKKTKKL